MNRSNGASEGLALLFEPGAVGFVKMGRNGVEDALVVLIEPSQFVLVEHILDDARGVDVAESQRVEALELALLRRVARSGIGCIDDNVEGAHEHQVFMTNAVFAARR